MAQKAEFTAKMTNSDNEQRKYNISCDVHVVGNTPVEVKDIVVTKDGIQVAHGSINRFNEENPHIQITVMELPSADYLECVNEIYSFASQAAQDAVGE